MCVWLSLRRLLSASRSTIAFGVLGRLRRGAVHSMAMHTAQVQRACHRSCCPMVWSARRGPYLNTFSSNLFGSVLPLCFSIFIRLHFVVYVAPHPYYTTCDRSVASYFFSYNFFEFVLRIDAKFSICSIRGDFRARNYPLWIFLCCYLSTKNSSFPRFLSLSVVNASYWHVRTAYTQPFLAAITFSSLFSMSLLLLLLLLLSLGMHS